MAPVGHVSGFLMVAFSVLLETFESYPKNRVLISFPSPPEATALLFPVSKRIFLFLLFPLNYKGENSFLSTVASSRKQCCPAGLTVLLLAFSWLQVWVAVTPAWHQEPNHSLRAPPELEFKRSLVCSHDVDRDSGWNGCVCVGFSIFIACFTPSNLCSLL